MADASADDTDREPFRTMRASITLLEPESQPRSLLISSSLPSEGKSWIAANLAVAFAQKGERTVLIDADLRRPALHKMLGASKDRGLTDLLVSQDEAHSATVTVESHDAKFDLLPAGPLPPSPSELHRV